MRIASSAILVLVIAFAARDASGGSEPFARLRPPAVPLVACDPYFSIWSPSNRLVDSATVHWTGKPHALVSMIRVDGEAWRLMGLGRNGRVEVPNALQTGLEVLPTRTIYRFRAGKTEVKLSFMTPLLPGDIDSMSWPLAYVTWDVRSVDGQPHDVSLFFSASAEIAVNTPDQLVGPGPSVATAGTLDVVSVGTVDQPVLEKDGDDLRIDWGYLYLAADKEARSSLRIAPERAAQGQFAKGEPGGPSATVKPRRVDQDWPSLVWQCELGQINQQSSSRHVMLAYDDIYSLEYLGTRLRPYWRRHGADAAALLTEAASRYDELQRRAADFDRALITQCRQAGGDGYAALCALAYREAIAGHKLAAGPKGEPMLFGKENFSNGCVGTVDVIYPAAPMYLLLDNELMKALVRPVLEYAATPRWKFPFAPHDVGRYPKANGQVYGGGEKTLDRQMPVEESGNMLILMAAISAADGNAQFVRPYWGLLETWAGYLKEKGLDPENQLCTDDFAGHLAHNVNLSVKAIEALGSFAWMAEMLGKNDLAAEYRRTAEQFAAQWAEMADDGDHFRLAFDLPGTWSQKYNLVWDRFLKLNLFPDSVVEKEIAFYRSQLREFGLPLDNRSLYTKTDWQVWTATLAGNRNDFDELMRPVYAFVNRTPQRVPMTDWYWTHDAAQRGFQARPVVGGVFIKALAEKW